MPLEGEPTADISAAALFEPSPFDGFGGDGADFPTPPFEDSFPFALPMLLLLLLLLLLNTWVTLSMTLPLMMIPILEAALRDDEAAEAAAEWAEEAGGAALGAADPPSAAELAGADGRQFNKESFGLCFGSKIYLSLDSRFPTLQKLIVYTCSRAE